MNTWVGIGRLVRDPEVRYTQSGKAVCRFTLAIDDGWGEKKKTYFIPVTCWEKLAEACGNNLVKGQKIAVEGRIQTRSYEAKDGTKRYVTEVVVQSMEFCESRRNGSAGGAGDYPGMPVPDEEIPF